MPKGLNKSVLSVRFRSLLCARAAVWWESKALRVESLNDSEVWKTSYMCVFGLFSENTDEFF